MEFRLLHGWLYHREDIVHYLGEPNVITEVFERGWEAERSVTHSQRRRFDNENRVRDKCYEKDYIIDGLESRGMRPQVKEWL